MTYIELMQKPGKQIHPKVYYFNDTNEKVTFEYDDIIQAKPFFNAPIVGTVMKSFSLELSSKLPNKPIYFSNTVKYDGVSATKTFGPYYLKETPEFNADSKTYSHNLCDNFINAMVEYKPITINYPCTVLAFFKQLCIECGFTTNITSLPNGSRIIESDIYENIGFTYRDVYEDIGQATATLFKINNLRIEKCSFGTEEITINDDLLKNQNIKMGEHFGPINSIILSRSADADFIYKRDESLTKWNEFKIVDNQLMNNNNRSEYLQELYDSLYGIQFDIYDLELIGYGGFEPLQKIKVISGEQEYSSYIFNNEQVFTDGFEESIFNDMPEENESDYKVSDTEDKKLNQAYIILNKQEKRLDALLSETTENTSKITSLEMDLNGVKTSVEETNTQIANLSELKGTVEGNNDLIIEDALESNAIEYKIKGKSEQKTTTNGKNKCPTSIDEWESGHYSFDNGEKEDYGGRIRLKNLIKINPNTQYYFTTFKDPYHLLVRSYDKNRNFVKNVGDMYNGQSYTATETEYYFSVSIYNTGTASITFEEYETLFNNGAIRPFICLNSETNKDYEEYIPDSPSPNYPQKIKSIEGIHNYFKIADSQTKNGITFTKNEDGSFDIIGTSTARTTFAIRESSGNIPNGAWTMSSNIKLSTGVFSVFEEWQGNTWLKDIVNVNSNKQTDTKYKFIKSGNQVVYYVGVEANTTVDLHNIRIQLERGNKIHGFTPYGKYLKIVNNNENLFDVNDTRDITNGITKIEDDWITATYDNTNGTSIKWLNYFTNKSKLLKENTNYAIFLEVKEVNGNRSITLISNNNDSNKAQFGISKSYQFKDMSDNTIYKYIATTRDNFSDCYTMLRTFISIHPGESGSITFRISVVENTDLTVEDFEYKPYDQKEILIPFKKENLFDKDNPNILDNAYIYETNGKVVSSNGNKTLYVQCKPNTTYIVKKILSSRFCVGTFSTEPVIGSTINKAVRNYEASELIIDTNEQDNFLAVWFYREASDTDITYQEILDSIKIYEGTDSNDYWSFDSVGDVRDELEVVNNRIILHKKNDKITLNGSETINRLSSAYSTFRFSVKTGSDNILKIAGVSDINPIMSNKFKAGNRANTYNQIESICYGSGTSEYGDFNIYCDETKNMTAAEFKTWLSNNPVEVLYQLIEPYDVDLGQVSVPLRQGYNKLTLVEDLETNTSATYLRDNVLNEEFARQLDLDITNDNLNSTKNDVSNLNTDVHNNYQDLLGKINELPGSDLITQINQKVEEVITSTSKVTTVVEEIQVNGVPVVKTETGVTVDKRGVSVDKTGASTSSTLDEAGLEVKDKTSSNETTQFYSGLADQEFINKNPELADFLNQVLTYTNNLYVKNQIQRPNGRWEPVEHPVHGKGEGIFIRRSN